MAATGFKLFAAGAAAVAYLLSRGAILNWGATEEEIAATLPGDELLPDATGLTTRAIDIDAPAEAVWPWIAQMGPSPRGGAYTYDWIENLLGLDFHSVDHVLPEFQNPQEGERIEFGDAGMEFARIDPGEAFVLRSGDGRWVWSFTLREAGGRTRLISRNRFDIGSPWVAALMEPMIPASLIMERKMLLGIKERAERLATGE